MAFMVICTALVFLMIPGVGYVFVSILVEHSMLMFVAGSSTLVWPDASAVSLGVCWITVLSVNGRLLDSVVESWLD
jgi:ammonia channel protein AmtB